MALDQWSQFLKDTRLESGRHSKPVRFASGLVLSVQASAQNHYCTPKENDPVTGWSAFEVWAHMPVSLHDQDTMGASDPQDVIMNEPLGWVSIEQLDAVAVNNGGIAGCTDD